MSAKKWLCKICADGCYLAGTDRQISFCRSYKPQTNADRIRAMSDEELAKWIDTMYCKCLWCDNKKDCNDIECTDCIVDWLRQPVKDGEDDD